MKTYQNLVDDLSPKYNDIEYIDAKAALYDGKFLSSYDVTAEQVENLLDNVWPDLPKVYLFDNLESWDFRSNTNEASELVDFVLAHKDWIKYREAINVDGVPANPEDPSKPHPSWVDYEDETSAFHPDDLLQEAGKACGWHSVPDSGWLKLLWTKEKVK